MAESQKTTGEFRKSAEITDDEINVAVDGVLAKPGMGSYPIGGGYLLDTRQRTRLTSPPPGRSLIRSPRRWQRTMARTAILTARPEEA